MKRAITTFLILIFVMPASLSTAEDGNGYTYAPPKHFGTGKSFMGRQIANVVDINQSFWFDRPEREQDEGTQKLIPLLGLHPNDVVADIGAGTGYFSFRLSAALPAGKIYAEDIQKGMLDVVKARKARGEGSNVEPVLGSETDPMLPPESVDLILLVDVYHEMLYPREMGQAMMRALKPGGRIAMVEFRGEDADVPAANLHKMTVEQARKEMGAMGFIWLSTDSTTLPQHHLMMFAKR